MTVSEWIDPALSLRFTAALLHFLWQGCAMGVVVVAGGFLLKRAPAQWRYVLNVSALLLIAACLPVTFMLLESPPADSLATIEAPLEFQPATVGELPVFRGQRETAVAGETPSNSATFVPAVAVSDPQPLDGPAGSTLLIELSPIAPWLTAIYLFGVALMLARLAVGVRGGNRLRQSAVPIEDATLLGMVRHQARQIGLRSTPAIAWCQQISIPVVIGIVRPMVLLPAALAAGLSPDQMQAVITHELAHIRRFDLFVNMIQRLVEAVLFFHPVVWFVSRRISVEREHAADDMVLTTGWRPPHYADALLRMAELSSSLRNTGIAHQTATLAASGTGSTDLKRRVMRLIDDADTAPLRLTRGGLAIVTILVLVSLSAPIVIHALAQSPSDDSNRDSQLPDPALDDSQLPEIANEAAFGEAKHGIQLGIAVSRRRRTFSMDERIPLTLLYRNVGAEPLAFKTHLDFVAYPPSVKNEQGESIPVSFILHFMDIAPTTITLQPGEVWKTETPGLGFQGQGISSLTSPSPGTYRLTYSAGIFAGESDPRHSDSAVPTPDVEDEADTTSSTDVSVLTSAWSEHLTTGELEFVIAPATDGRLEATVAPKAPPRGDSSPAPGQTTDTDEPATTSDDTPPADAIDKATLPRVAEDFQHSTTVRGGLVTGGGIIERIEDDAIYFRSGDHIAIERQSELVVPGFGGEPIRILDVAALQPGMVIGYSLRNGVIEKLTLTGNVVNPPTPGETVFDTIRELGLQQGAEVNDSLDGRFPMRLTGKDGPVLIAIGQTKLIELPEPTMSVEWQIADYQPEAIDDFEPFDYLLVQWRSNGRITWTCYQSPAVAAGNDPAELPTPPPADERSKIQELQRELEQIQSLETAADGEADSGKRVELLRQAVEEYEEFHNQHRSQLAGLWSRFYQSRCLQKLGDDEGAEEIFEELLELPGSVDGIRRIQDEIEELAGGMPSGTDESRTVSESEQESDQFARLADSLFARLDHNQDGVLQPDEIPERLDRESAAEVLDLLDLRSDQLARLLFFKQIGAEVQVEPAEPRWLHDLVAATLGEERAEALTDLIAVDLGDTRVTDAALQHLIGLTKLKRLMLDDTQITDAGLESVTRLTNLEILSLGDTHVTDAGLRLLSGLTKLKALYFHQTQVSDGGLRHLRGLTDLEVLYLDSTQITDTGLEYLSGLSSLRTLDVNDTQVADAGLRHLSGLANLHTLDLGNTKITDAGLEHLRRLTDLKSLHISNTEVTAAGLAQLRSQRPDLFIQ